MSEKDSFASNQKLAAELRSWIGWPEKELDVLLRRAAEVIERIPDNAECNGPVHGFSPCPEHGSLAGPADNATMTLGPPDCICPKCGAYIMNPWDEPRVSDETAATREWGRDDLGRCTNCGYRERP